MKIKTKKGAISIEKFAILFLAIAVFVLIGAFVIKPLFEKGGFITEVIPEQGCKSRPDYSLSVQFNYNAQNHEKGLKEYIEFKACYEGEKLTGIPDEINIFYEKEYADYLAKKSADPKKSKELYYTLIKQYQDRLNNNSNNITISTDAVKKIHEIYMSLFALEKDSAEKTSIANDYIAVLKLIRDNYLDKPGNKVPMDLVLINAGAILVEKKDYPAAFDFYQDAIRSYPTEDKATGQGIYAKKAEDRIIELANIFRELGRNADATQLCFWLNNNYISENGKTRSTGCLNALYDRFACKWYLEGQLISLISCSEYTTQYFCIADKCKIGPCTWIGSSCFEQTPPVLPT